MIFFFSNNKINIKYTLLWCSHDCIYIKEISIFFVMHKMSDLKYVVIMNKFRIYLKGIVDRKGQKYE